MVEYARKYWMVVAVLILWQVAAGSPGASSVIPTPLSVIEAGKTLVRTNDPALGNLIEHIQLSLKRQLTGFGLAILVAIPLGLVMGLSAKVRDALLPPVQVLYPVPGLAWTPLAILWMGLGSTTVIFLIFIGAVWPILYGTIGGLQNLRVHYRRAAQSLGATPLYYVTRVALPGSFAMILTGLRLGYGASWRQIVGAEMIASTSGMGYMLSVASDVRRADVILLGMVIIGLLGYLIEYVVFGGLDRLTLERWGTRETT